jgi:hypothetical protein
VRICECADSPQSQHFSDFPEFPHPHIRTLKKKQSAKQPNQIALQRIEIQSSAIFFVLAVWLI